MGTVYGIQGVSKMRILIVDDNKDGAYLLKALLKDNGHDIVSAKNGVAALKILKKDSVDMIISDILMPEMDGFQLCRKCKTNDMLRKIPFVFYTGTYTDEKDQQFALSLGANRFIVKPMGSERFMEIINEVVKEFEEGVTDRPEIPPEDNDAVYLKKYVERLTSKFEEKILQLEKEIAERKRVEEALEKEKELLERTNKLMTGRELRVIEVKKEVNLLLEELGRPKKYPV